MFHSAISKEGDSAPRTGFFHFFKRQEVRVEREEGESGRERVAVVMIG